MIREIIDILFAAQGFLCALR